MSIKTFVHNFQPATRDDAPILLLLHGTGGDEKSMLDIGRRLDAGAGLLSLRGNVPESADPNDGARFFRRIPGPGWILDVEDMIVRTHELAAFLPEAATTYHFELRNLVAVGYSNGANFSVSLLALHPTLLNRAVLFRALLPPKLEPLPDLSGKQVLISAGKFDPIMQPPAVEALATALRNANAIVKLSYQDGNHSLTLTDIDTAKKWLNAPRKQLNPLV